MTYLYQWTKNLVFFYILMAAVMHLLPQKSYRKYLRFFGGLVLAILLLGPIFQVLGKEEELIDRISYESFWQDMDTAALDIKELEQWQQNAYLEEYEKAIASDIAGMVPEEFMVKEVQVKLAEEVEIQTVELYLEWAGSAGGIRQPALVTDSSEYPALTRLKERIKEFYEISEEQIRIYM